MNNTPIIVVKLAGRKALIFPPFARTPRARSNPAGACSSSTAVQPKLIL